MLKNSLNDNWHLLTDKFAPNHFNISTFDFLHHLNKNKEFTSIIKSHL